MHAAVAVVLALFPYLFFASTSRQVLLQKAREAWFHAQALENALNDKPAEERTRPEYLKVINAYQRVYLITPHTGYADNALMTVARLYEEIKDSKAAVRTLAFLIREYPKTPFRDAAERDIARLEGTPERRLSMVSVDNIRYWEGANSVRVVVDLSSEVQFKQGEAKSPDRVFVDLSQARLNSALVGRPMPVKSGMLQQIRVGQYDNSTVRVVLDVGTIGRVTSFALRDPDRLIIDVFGTEVAGLPAQPAATPEIASATVSEISAPTATTPTTSTMAPLSAPASVESKPATPAAKTKPAVSNEPRIVPAKPTRAGDRSLLRSLGLKLQRVVIDPGHGGHDTGTIGPGGYTEKELVLDVAQRLKDIVQTRLSAEVLLTREDDTFVPLETRTAIANQHEGDLFISIHANSSRVRTVRGVETYYLNITTSREALDVAMRENAASERSIHEQQSLIKNIMLRDKMEESRELARVIQKSLAGRKDAGTNRGVKQAPFIVLIGASMPSVLAEISFISNPHEEKLLKTAEYRQQIAESLFDGVRSYSESLSGLKTAKTQDKNQEH